MGILERDQDCLFSQLSFFYSRERGLEQQEPVYCNRLCLANAMTAVFSLSVNLWVEIHVMNDNSISSSQVQTLTSSSRGQQACKYRSIIVKRINYCLSL